VTGVQTCALPISQSPIPNPQSPMNIINYIVDKLISISYI